jgi:FtsH-binding integral membrane protein
MEQQSYPENGQLQAANSAALAKSFLNKVYLWMAVCMLITAGVAAFTAQDTQSLMWVAENHWLVALGTLGIVFFMSFGANRLSYGALTVLLLTFAGVQGLLFGPMLVVYKMDSIAQAFACTAAMFGGMSIYGAVTKRNLSTMGRTLMMLLIGLLVAMIVNIFMGSGMLDLCISCAGVVIFALFTAYDTQRLIELGTCEDEEVRSKGAVLGALSLYLDFINLFLMLLRLFGRDE